MEKAERLCIVPCGAAKIWDKQPSFGAVQAQHAYTGVFAAACQRYASMFFDHWVILSAKHGFLYPEELIPEDYNVSFVKSNSETITTQQLIEQVQAKGLTDYKQITVLGGKHYTNRAKEVFTADQELSFPLSGCRGIGYMLQKVTQAVESRIEIAATDHTQQQGLALEAKATETSPAAAEAALQKPYSGKYEQLYRYLAENDSDSLTLSVEKIEKILGFSLPQSAYDHRPWWANTLSHSHAKSWLMAEWEVDTVHLGNQVSFKKML